MKKVISLLLALVTLIMFAVPVLAEEPYETISYVYSATGGNEHFSFYSNRQDSLENAWVAGDKNWYFKLFADEKSGLQIKDIELRYVNGDFANAAISCGTKVDPEKSYRRGDWLRVNNIHSKAFTLGVNASSDYTAIVFDEIRVYYEDAEIIEEDHEIIYYDFGSKSYSENFCLESGEIARVWWGIDKDAKIYSTNKNYQIKRLEIFLYDDKKYDIVVSSGKCRENGAEVKAGDVVHIDDIHSPSVSFSTNNRDGYYCLGTDVIVYYEPSGTAFVLSEGNGTIAVGIACLAIGLCGGLLIGKRKQKAEEE